MRNKIKVANTEIPAIFIRDKKVYLISDANHEWKLLEKSGRWTLLKTITLDEGHIAIVEDFSLNGSVYYIRQDGSVLYKFPKRLESTKNSEAYHYLGYPKDVALSSRSDLMGQKILARPEDPNYVSVESCIPPIRISQSISDGGEAPHTFIGTRESRDIIPLYYSTQQAFSRINNSYVSKEMNKAVEDHTIFEGLYGGWLPIVVMRYPVDEDSYWEMMTFAKTTTYTKEIQPAWYRFIKVYRDEVEQLHYYDSYLPYPQRSEPDGEEFYKDMLRLRDYWEKELAQGMKMEISAEQWIPDFCKHAMVLEMITRTGPHPHYGVVVRTYASQEHDGFQDIFTGSVACYLEWGKFDNAKAYIENYFDYFVRNNGQLEYRGAEIGQYGWMLAQIAQYYDYTGDPSLADKYDNKLHAIIDLLMHRRKLAKRLPKEDPAYGMICGHHEADINFIRRHINSVDYEVPYISNSTGAWRGFRDLGMLWKKVGGARGDKVLAACGEALLSEAEELRKDILRSLEKSVLTDRGYDFLPAIAGSKLYSYDYPGHVIPDSDAPGRTYLEMMHAGMVPKRYIEMIMKNASNFGMKLGIFSGGKIVASFLSYGQAYGLIQYDMIREFLLYYYAHALHMHTRGTWTNFECVDLDRDRGGDTGYCTPGQVTIPTITKLMLVFEDPMDEILWLCKATPREWLADGEFICVRKAPTRWGSVGLSLNSQIDDNRIYGSLEIPDKLGEIFLRLRVPTNKRISSVRINSRDIEVVQADSESIVIPQEFRGKLDIEIQYQ